MDPNGQRFLLHKEKKKIELTLECSTLAVGSGVRIWIGPELGLGLLAAVVALVVAVRVGLRLGLGAGVGVEIGQGQE